MPQHFDTLAIHAGQPNDPETGSITFPIYQTSTFAQDAPGETKGYCYARTENPNREALERLLGALEGAKHGRCFASGLAAANACIMLLKAGDHVVASKDIYGGAYRAFSKVFSNFGMEFTFVDPVDLTAMAAAFKPNTTMLWLETPSNPKLAITDIAAACAIAKKHGALTVCDNTFATPYLQRPLDLGVDIVLHSTTKYLNGHGDVISGALLTNNDELAQRLHFLQNTLGGVPGPQDCFLIMRGIKTLSLRMDRHCENARAVAEFLAAHPKVETVYFPGLTTHVNHDVAKKQMRDFGGMVSAELKCSVADAKAFASRTKLFTLAESLGVVKSLLCHPASMTHASVEPEVRRKHGLSDGLIRLSVGIEHKDDIIDDLRVALEQVPS